MTDLLLGCPWCLAECAVPMRRAGGRTKFTVRFCCQRCGRRFSVSTSDLLPAIAADEGVMG